MAREGAEGARSYSDLAARLRTSGTSRVVWLMVPAAVVDSAIAELQPVLERGDTIVDGGNSYYVDDLRRAREKRRRWGWMQELTPYKADPTHLSDTHRPSAASQ